jgi:hypothetical protein
LELIEMFTALQIGPYGSKARILAMADGVRALGGEVRQVSSNWKDLRREPHLRKAQFAFTCGMQEDLALARGWLRGLDIPLLVLDCGYLRRASGPADDAGYNQLGLERLCWVPPIRCDAARFAELDVAIAPAAWDRPKIALLLGQVPADSQHHLGPRRLASWLAERATCALAAGWQIIYRPHPKAPDLPLPISCDAIDPLSEPLSASFARASVAITYNSTSGLEALMAGLRVECDSSAHFAGLEPGTPELRDHCERLAWAQWTCAELRTGEPIRWMNHFANLLPQEVHA